MKRFYFIEEKERAIHRKKLDEIKAEILENVPGSAVASDQFCRVLDLAIDFCEDVPSLSPLQVQKIVKIFEKHGAQAKISSIHVNGWFGQYDKLTQTLNFLKKEFAIDAEAAKKVCAFSGDSPNDEPMWNFFPLGIAVANISQFLPQLRFKPAYITRHTSGKGFVELSQQILKNK